VRASPHGAAALPRAPDGPDGAPLARVRAATLELRRALAGRDAHAVAAVADATGDLSPRALAEGASPAQVAQLLRPWIEAWDDVLCGWWFADGDGPEHWRALLLPEGGWFPQRWFLFLPLWLRAVESERVGRTAAPRGLAGRPVDVQARALGRFLVRADGVVPADYARLHAELDPALRPVLAFWALGVHATSPWLHLDERVHANRAALVGDFARVHADAPVDLAADPLLGQAGYRSVYYEADPRAFVQALSERVLKPAFDAFCGSSGATSHPAGRGGVGVLLTTWNEHHAVRRSVGPLLDGLRATGPTAFGTSADRARFVAGVGSAWSTAPVRLDVRPAETIDEIAELARTVRAHDLDFLFFPEAALTNAARWLATQRLARVQATTYGHPVTTGSSTMDYFVGGELFEDDGARYRERLVLLPGLGHGVTPPPVPTAPRRRPVDDARCRFASLSTADKLNAPVLRAWDAVLDAAPAHSALEVLPAVHGARARSLAAGIGAWMRPGRATVVPTIPRIECLNRLVECDVALDAFPYGGFNSTVDALVTGLPVVTLEGPGMYGRSSAAVLRLLGIDAYTVARSPAEYVELARRLANDAGLRRELRARLTREHVLASLVDPELPAHFAAAVEWMRATGPGRPGPPVRVSAGEPVRPLT